MTEATNRWIVRPVPRAHASARLFCFPHAGAGAVIFRDWYSAFPPHIEVCAIEPPGRLARRQERLISDVNEFVQALRGAIDPLLDRPFAFMGYSLGTLMAFELARSLRRQRKLEPFQMTFAAGKAPQLPRRLQPISHESTPSFAREVERRYGPFDALIKGDPEMFELVLNITRADMALLEGYKYYEEPAFECPVLAIAGRADPTVNAAELEGWREQTHGSFRSELLPGGHFFLRTAGADLRRLVREAVAPETTWAATP